VAVFLLTGLSAQKAEVKWGAPLDLETSIQRFLAEKNGKFFTLSNHKDDLFLERYNSVTFKQEFSKLLEIPELEGKEQTIESIIYLQNRFLIFTSLYSNKLNTFTVHAYSVNGEGVMSKDSPELFSIEANSRAEGGDVGFLISEDSTRILVTHYAYFKKEKMQRITMTVLDENLKKVTEAKEEFPRKEEGHYHLVSNYALNNTGEIFLLHMEITPAVRKTPAITKYTIISFNTAGKRQKDFPIDLEGKRIDRLSFSFDVNQNLLVSGFYEGKAGDGLFKYSGITGTFFMSIDKNSGQEKARSFKDFDKEILESYYEQKQLDKGALLPNNFVSREIIQKEDGGVICVYEQYYYIISQSQRGTMESTFYGDLLVTNINPDGTIKWVKIIPKRQVFNHFRPALGIGVPGVTVSFLIDTKSDQTIYYSYLLAITGDQIVFVFNDSPENKELQPAYDTEVMTKIKGTIPMMVSLSESGNLIKKTLFEATDFDIIIRPRISFQSSDTRILIYGSKKDNDKFGVLTVE
jgi:hypothetical protein